MAVLTLNSAARGIAALGSATKIRARNVDGVLFIRPTDRKSLSIGVQSGPPIGVQEGPLCGCADRLMLGACFALLAA